MKKLSKIVLFVLLFSIFAVYVAKRDRISVASISEHALVWGGVTVGLIAAVLLLLRVATRKTER